MWDAHGCLRTGKEHAELARPKCVWKRGRPPCARHIYDVYMFYTYQWEVHINVPRWVPIGWQLSSKIYTFSAYTDFYPCSPFDFCAGDIFEIEPQYFFMFCCCSPGTKWHITNGCIHIYLVRFLIRLFANSRHFWNRMVRWYKNLILNIFTTFQ